MTWFDAGRDPRPVVLPAGAARSPSGGWPSASPTTAARSPACCCWRENADEAARRILHESISWQEGNKFAEVVPLFRQGDRTGSTAGVDFITTKEVYPTGEKCHVNYVVLDGIGGNLWEKAVAEILETLPSVAAYVKNDRLGFTIPYAMQGRSHEYIPDFLVRLKPRDDDDPVRTLIVEVSGTLKKADADQGEGRHHQGPVAARDQRPRRLRPLGVRGADRPQDVPRRPERPPSKRCTQNPPSSPVKELSVMPPRKKQPTGPVPVEAFKHEDKRVNIPTADSSELVSPDVAQPTQLRYPRNPDLDPQLVWTGKDEQDGEDLVVDAPPIYIQEKIVPQVIIENLRKVVEKPQLSLFDDFDGLEGYEAVEYYQHEANWSNRMILGDSLQVMASLAEKENLRGKVQMIYIDPPYGIKFGSNWQVSHRQAGRNGRQSRGRHPRG